MFITKPLYVAGDRAKSKTPPPKLSDITFDQKRPLYKDAFDEEREGYKYLSLIDTEKDSILKKVSELEQLQKNSSIPEEASGKIRAACGKANLLISQKFEQFKGLCWKNIVSGFACLYIIFILHNRTYYYRNSNNILPNFVC